MKGGGGFPPQEGDHPPDKDTGRDILILIRPGRQVLWPRAPLCLGPQELIWLLVLVLLLLLLLFLLQV